MRVRKLKPTDVLVKIGGKKLDISLTDILENRGIKADDLLSEKAFSLKWSTLEEAVQKTKHFLLDYNRFGVLYDVDVDGLVSGKQIEEKLKKLGVLVFRHMNTRKLHGLNKSVFDWALKEKIEVLYVVDAGTNDIEWHKKFSAAGIKVIVLDHHEQWAKEKVDDVYIVNCSVDENGELPKLSGAGVCYRFIELLDRELHGNGVTHYEPWIGLTVLSDQCSMLDKENRYYIDRLYENYDKIDLFNAFTYYGSRRNLFVYSVIPFLNACIRMNEVEVAMTVVGMQGTSQIKSYIDKNREYVLAKQNSQLEDMKKTSRYLHGEEVVLVRLSEKNKAYSGLTGLFANKVLADTGKSVIVMYDDGELFKGSFRGKKEMTSDILTTLGWRMKGHQHAAGIELDRENSLDVINKTLTYKTAGDFQTETFDFELEDKDVPINIPFLEKVARFNERASGDIDTIKFKLHVTKQPYKEVFGKRASYNFLSFEVRDFKVDRKDNNDSWIVEIALSKDGINLMRV